jgi:hypothetical protein
MDVKSGELPPGFLAIDLHAAVCPFPATHDTPRLYISAPMTTGIGVQGSEINTSDVARCSRCVVGVKRTQPADRSPVQGPGANNLMALGRMADRILMEYITAASILTRLQSSGGGSITP